MTSADDPQFESDHRWAHDRMSDALDAELDEAGRRRMEHHLKDCPECREFLHALRRLVGELGTLPVPSGVPAVDALLRRVRDRLHDAGQDARA